MSGQVFKKFKYLLSDIHDEDMTMFCTAGLILFMLNQHRSSFHTVPFFWSTDIISTRSSFTVWFLKCLFLSRSRRGRSRSRAAATASTGRFSTSAVSPPASEFCGGPSRPVPRAPAPLRTAAPSPVRADGSPTGPCWARTPAAGRGTSQSLCDTCTLWCRNSRRLPREKSSVWRNGPWRWSHLRRACFIFNSLD